MAKQPSAMSKAKRRTPRRRRIDYGILTGLVGYRLRRAQAAVFGHFLDSVGEHGVTPGQFGVLILIEANPRLSQSALAEALGIERSTMVTVIDRLESRGWVARKSSKTDRRSYALALTKAGAGLLARVTPLVRRHERQFNAGLGKEEKAVLIELLERVAAAAGRS
ncbi:MAG: MarR family transcriptional regulator [Proteobacteria bacterium]|nr:MarR family transcriptional regulator [Pseudomonadota bacterium]